MKLKIKINNGEEYTFENWQLAKEFFDWAQLNGYEPTVCEG